MASGTWRPFAVPEHSRNGIKDLTCRIRQTACEHPLRAHFIRLSCRTKCPLPLRHRLCEAEPQARPLTPAPASWKKSYTALAVAAFNPGVFSRSASPPRATALAGSKAWTRTRLREWMTPGNLIERVFTNFFFRRARPLSQPYFPCSSSSGFTGGGGRPPLGCGSSTY